MRPSSFSVGEHNGMLNKKQYFSCVTDCGVFLPVHEVVCTITRAVSGILERKPDPIVVNFTCNLTLIAAVLCFVVDVVINSTKYWFRCVYFCIVEEQPVLPAQSWAQIVGPEIESYKAFTTCQKDQPRPKIPCPIVGRLETCQVSQDPSPFLLQEICWCFWMSNWSSLFVILFF